MSDTTWIIAFVLIMGGIISGSIASDRRPGPGTFWSYFAVGFLIPIIGIISALMIKRPVLPPQPPGWYQDPWNPTDARWFDGYTWTWHTYEGQPISS